MTTVKERNMESVLVVIFALSGLLDFTNGQMCPNEWTSFDGSCYTLGSDLMSWTDAEELCQLFNANLAVIETRTENEFLKRFLNEHHATNHVWIGATDVFNEDHFMWIRTFQALDFTDWSANEPNHAHGADSEDCVQMRRELQWMWNDESCAQTDHFVCEMEVGNHGIIG